MSEEDKFILMKMDDERSKDIAEIMGNKTCKKIIDYLSEKKDASEQDIARNLGIPLNTAEYNLKKMIKAGLIEKTKNFFWSTKGKKIETFKLANKHIIISTKQKSVNMDAVKSILGVLIALIAVSALVFLFYSLYSPQIRENVPAAEMKKFASYSELVDFLNKNTDTEMDYYGGFGMRESLATDSVSKFDVGNAAPSAASGGAGEGDYSQTNIQVEGVDEADIVKNDGKYIYIVSGQKVFIVDAYPADSMKIISTIELNDSISNILVNKDKLVLFSNEYNYVSSYDCVGIEGIRCGGYSQNNAILYEYDLTDRTNPVLAHTLKAEGYYQDSRMIGDYVYFITSNSIDMEEIILPYYSLDGVNSKVAAEEIYYPDTVDMAYSFTSVFAFNLESGDTNSKTFLTGYTGAIYVSPNNIYLTNMKRFDRRNYYDELIRDVFIKILPEDKKKQAENIMATNVSSASKLREVAEIVGEYSQDLRGEDKAQFDEKLMKEYQAFTKKILKQREKTQIHRISLDNEKIEYEASGEVPGSVLNQFSMDEFKGNFRIATTLGNSWWMGFSANSTNHLYVLDSDLDIVGSVEDLASGERIYSVRFMGERAYMVTFRQVDPLYVLSLKIPEQPEVLGYLKIEGVSDYLHPYDENTVIGIGRDASAQGTIKGLKIALFDVSDVANPKEKAKLLIGERGTSSEATYNHKAVLFDKDKNLLVLPVSLVENASSWRTSWKGAYVLNIDASGIGVRGRITHYDKYVPKYGPAANEPIGAERDDGYGRVWVKFSKNESYGRNWRVKQNESEEEDDYYYYSWKHSDEDIDAMKGGISYSYFDSNYNLAITRSLYIGDSLYTISGEKVKANDLISLDEVKNVEIPITQYDYDNSPRMRGLMIE